MRARGMTLVEVMIVVVIVGVLSAIGIYSVTRYIRASQASEAGTIINAIKGAQEVYRQDTMQYLDVSNGNFGNSFPSADPLRGAKQAWAGEGETADNFKLLGVDVDSAVYFVYSCVAVRAGATMPAPPTSTITDFGLNADAIAAEPRYMVVAKGDLDGDGTFSYAVSHNLMNEVYTENEGD